MAARLVSACIFMAAALHQGVNPWFPAKPDYWYSSISGMPGGTAKSSGTATRMSSRPTGPGNVQENAWAFYALFPFLGRAVAG